MENASKALLIAGGMLIALLTITLVVLMFNRINEFYSEDESTTTEEQIVKFNMEYEAYNRDNVRGTDLFSLLNKVANYNERKSSIGTEGSSIAYEAMTITFDLGDDLTLYTADGKSSQLLTTSSYTESAKKSTFRTSLRNSLNEIINKYGESNLENLSKSITKIFISNDSSDAKKKEAVENYNKFATENNKISDFKDINEKSKIRTDVYKYYEYVQFKRAHFKCTGTEYNKQTGRIVIMTFKFTGTFE